MREKIQKATDRAVEDVSLIADKMAGTLGKNVVLIASGDHLMARRIRGVVHYALVYLLAVLSPWHGLVNDKDSEDFWLEKSVSQLGFAYAKEARWTQMLFPELHSVKALGRTLDFARQLGDIHGRSDKVMATLKKIDGRDISQEVVAKGRAIVDIRNEVSIELMERVADSLAQYRSNGPPVDPIANLFYHTQAGLSLFVYRAASHGDSTLLDGFGSLPEDEIHRIPQVIADKVGLVAISTARQLRIAERPDQIVEDLIALEAWARGNHAQLQDWVRSSPTRVQEWVGDSLTALERVADEIKHLVARAKRDLPDLLLDAEERLEAAQGEVAEVAALYASDEARHQGVSERVDGQVQIAMKTKEMAEEGVGRLDGIRRVLAETREVYRPPEEEAAMMKGFVAAVDEGDLTFLGDEQLMQRAGLDATYKIYKRRMGWLKHRLEKRKRELEEAQRKEEVQYGAIARGDTTYLDKYRHNIDGFYAKLQSLIGPDLDPKTVKMTELPGATLEVMEMIAARKQIQLMSYHAGLLADKKAAYERTKEGFEEAKQFVEDRDRLQSAFTNVIDANEMLSAAVAVKQKSSETLGRLRAQDMAAKRVLDGASERLKATQKAAKILGLS